MPTRRPAASAAASAASTTRRLPSRPTRTSGASGGGAASPAFRRSRSVGPGRQEERDDPCHRTPPARNPRSRPRAAADQLDQPAMPADARAPAAASDGSAETRQRVIAAVGWPKSAASVCRRQRRSAMPIVPGPLGRELQPPRGRHRQARDLADHRRRGRRAAGLPPCRPAPSCRRRPRHRSPGREQARPGPAPARTGRAARRTRAPCPSCARRCRRRTARPPRRRSRRCRRRRPHAARRAPARRRGGGDPPRRSRREAPISTRRLRPSIFSICARSDSMADTARKLHRDLQAWHRG